MKNVCKYCQNEFYTARKDKKFCTDTCRSLAWKKSKKILSELNTGSTHLLLNYIEVEQGKLFEAIKLEKRVEDFLTLCHSMLWSTRDFTEEQKNSFKQFIAEHFKQCENIDNKFVDLVEKVVLTKRYVLEKPYRFIAEPRDWFNIRFYNGISAANKWHEALQAQRKESPEFGENLKIFAESILNYAERRNILDIAFYRQLFISLKEWDLLQWYMNAVMHYQFINF